MHACMQAHARAHTHAYIHTHAHTCLPVLCQTPTGEHRMSGISDEDEGPNLLEVEDVAPYLVFSREEEGGYSLCGGAVDALVAYAASPSNQGQNDQTFEHGCVAALFLPACGLLMIDVWPRPAVLSSCVSPLLPSSFRQSVYRSLHPHLPHVHHTGRTSC